MKKPVILLVDDDRDVLSALEAELAPAYRDVARIEAFYDPRAALDAVQGWAEEGRSVAVAIVDQKMPQLSGVEFLRRIRPKAPANDASTAPSDFSPTQHTQTIVLTGHAGLESALAALNDVGIRRYLEKPWDPVALATEVRSALARWLTESGAGVHFEFRMAADVEEVRGLLRLRFQIYKPMRLHAVLQHDAAVELDIDAYDRSSRHFGLFMLGAGNTRMTGGLRVVGQEDSIQLELLAAAVADLPPLIVRMRRAERALLPLLEYLPEREHVTRLVESLVAGGEGVTEPSRLVLLAEFRTMGIADQHLARFIIESAVAFACFFRIPHAMLTCVPEHQVFYRPYGFRLTEGTSIRHYEKLSQEIACLHGTMDAVPEPARSRVEAIAHRIAHTGATCRCASFPSCLGGPYETGDFSGVDVFCPLRARELTRNA